MKKASLSFLFCIPLICLLVFLISQVSLAQTTGTKKRRPLPDEYGNVTMNNLSEKNGMEPVVFRHWSHRVNYTCRVCHVDIGFAMQSNGTTVREEENRRGFFCGSCHNGKEAFSVLPIVKEGKDLDKRNCERCHSYGLDVRLERSFAEVTRNFPKGRFGNGVDWEQAELKGMIKLKDQVPGVSIVRKKLDVPRDYQIQTGIPTLPKIIFSHKKHNDWSGCELCHPDIFNTKAGTPQFSMQDNFSHKYCGLCHVTVAFPFTDCQRCHTEPVGV